MNGSGRLSTFAIIKELFNLNDETQLPYKGLTKVSAYLMNCTITIQIMMYHNYQNHQKLGDTTLLEPVSNCITSHLFQLQHKSKNK